MLHDLQEISWAQSKDKVTVTVPYKDGKDMTFPIKIKLVNYLVGNTPKLVYLYVQLEGQPSETTYYADFSGLEPIVLFSEKIVYKPNAPESDEHETKAEQKLKRKGVYGIARGESHIERYLGKEGWQRQKNFFDIFDFQEVQVEIKKQEEDTAKREKIETKHLLTTKYKNCFNCGSSISISEEICPNCQTKQFKHCISCNNKIAAEAQVCQFCGTAQTQQTETTKPQATDEGLDLII